MCSPCTDVVPAYFAHDLARMMGYTIRNKPDWELAHFMFPGSLIPKQREQLARDCLSEHCTHALWLDTDMRFPPSTMVRLVEHGKRIVAGNYVERRHPHRPVAFLDLARADERLYPEPDATGLVEVEAIGAGCMLVDCDVYRKLPEPWYMVGWIADRKIYCGEDVWFCSKARENGEQVWVDQELSNALRHIGQLEYGMGHARQMREHQPAEA